VTRGRCRWSRSTTNDQRIFHLLSRTWCHQLRHLAWLASVDLMHSYMWISSFFNRLILIILKPARLVSWRTSTSIWFHMLQFTTHALLHCFCWLCQNGPLISLSVLFLTRHLLSGTVYRQTFYSVILTLSSGNIWKHFCSLPPEWQSSSASVAPHMALYK